VSARGAKEKAQQVAGPAKEKAQDGVAGELRRQGKEGQARVAEQAAEKVKAAGEYLQQADGESLVQTAANVARENPAAAAAAAVGAAAGFAAGRVIKASTRDDRADDVPPAAADVAPEVPPADDGPGVRP